MRVAVGGFFVWSLAACGKGEIAAKDDSYSGEDKGNVYSDTDTDTDTDSDADGDADTDTTETGDTAIAPIPRLFDAYHLLVVPNADGLAFVANDGSVAHAYSWAALMGSCNNCTGEGASADGDGILFSFFGQGNDQGIARLNATATLDWVIKGMSFPHDAIRDPADETVLVPEAFADAINWYPGDGSGSNVVRSIDDHTPGWTQSQPNGAEKVDYDGKTYILESNRAAGNGTDQVSFWDITDPLAPSKLWVYPPSGTLDTPHGPVYRQYDGQWYLFYAHSYGGPGGQSAVGVAVTSDPLVAPAYVGDLVPDAPAGPFDFLRGVELTDDGMLWLTDSGPEFGAGTGRILSAPFPAGLAPSGETGAIGHQTFLDLPGAAVVTTGIDNPFEGWLWVPTIAF